MLEECSLGFVEQQVHQSGHIDAREDQAVHVKHAVKVADSFFFETLFSVSPANTARVEEGRQEANLVEDHLVYLLVQGRNVLVVQFFTVCFVARFTGKVDVCKFFVD